MPQETNTHLEGDLPKKPNKLDLLDSKFSDVEVRAIRKRKKKEKNEATAREEDRGNKKERRIQCHGLWRDREKKRNGAERKGGKGEGGGRDRNSPFEVC